MTDRTLLRGGWVVPMTAGQVPFRGDVLVEDERIAAVGAGGSDVDAAVVDCRNRIVLPGLVDSHRHLWQSALRGIAADWTLGQYFARIRGQLGGRFRPEDTYAGTLLGAVEALDAGITTVVDWSHNLNGPEHADAGWQALVDAGGRAVFAYGASNAQALARDGSPHTDDVRRLREGVGAHDGARITLGMAVRGPEFSTVEAAAADWGLARELGIPVTVHVGGGLRGAGGHVAELARRGLLGPDTTYVHCNLLSDAELDAIAEAGGRASVSPEVEADMGHGPVATTRLRARGIPTGLSVDVCTTVGGDLFGAMRAALALARGAAHEAALAAGESLDRVPLTAAEVLAMATIEGARAIGLDDRIGSLAPGKQADVLVLRADTASVAPLRDPVAAVVLAAGVREVDAVMVGGRWVKRDGRFGHRDVGAAVDLATRSHDRLLAGVRTEEWTNQQPPAPARFAPRPERENTGRAGSGVVVEPPRRNRAADRLGEARTVRPDPRPGEDDVDQDDAQALSRVTGGGPSDAPDATGTTGTGGSQEFVGRAGGQDVGYAGETGAERRAAEQQNG